MSDDLRHVEASLVLEKIAPTHVTTMVQAPTYSGRERIAQLIHALSPRAEGAFVLFDCTGVESKAASQELFGSSGALKQAEAGTLFIDRVDTLPKPIQERLFNMLDSGDIKPRLIVGTPIDLREHVTEGTFDEALYFRLSVARLKFG